MSHILSMKLTRFTYKIECRARKFSASTHIKPITPKQNHYLDQLQNSFIPVVIGFGPPGSGKTLWPCFTGIEKLLNKDVEKLVLTRPTINTGRDLGALPGNIEKKLDPWLRSIYDQMYKFYDKKLIQNLLSDEKIEICPLEFMRGRSFDSTYIIADEMQNSYPDQHKMLLTRIGQNTKLAITGDLEQTDIKLKNGLEDFIDRYDSMEKKTSLISIIEFDSDDVQRSEVVKEIIKIYK